MSEIERIHNKYTPRFDELAQQAAWELLERFWIPRSDMVWYQAVREREHVLRPFFNEKLGFRLLIHYEFVKLEKFVSRQIQPWMGLPGFAEVRDYVFFSLLMAFLEAKSIDDQFLLSDICEEIKVTYPGPGAVDWTNYDHRKSLVRVLQLAREWELLLVVDGDDQGFAASDQTDALYEPTPLVKYFLRAYPRDLMQFETTEDLLKIVDTENETLARRHRVYRQLLLTPGIREEEMADGDWTYLRNQRNVIARDFEETVGLDLEIYGQDAMLVHHGRSMGSTLYPDTRAISDVVFFFAGTVRAAIEAGTFPLQNDGRLLLTQVDYELLLEQCHAEHGHGWGKTLREMQTKPLAHQLLEEMEAGGMACRDENEQLIVIMPRLGRITSHYPNDYVKKRKEGDEKPDGIE
ncbi:TIGR02678 family protein [Brevibacillus composti]|uniref:TIGR02678 family protein n=1 Tax=Brevibacillus composti TaxID=2796470 RepID=A0A7T5EKU2_9BACL|nr:TIGR02678 family protein [Brevibacillus composti]QQE74405.1 TIGR02678 family protein [Brevibacillus composti]QUO41487.1 TIGR02678 family protein [Brevibacillus composti]